MAGTELLVLLAEDDDGHATLIERNLRRGGLRSEIVRLRDGLEVLDCFRKRNGAGGPIVLVLDIRMPRIDGLQVLRELKASEETAAVPVVVLTTTTERREIDLCYALGCSFFIVKSLEYSQFAETVQRLGAMLGLLQLPRRRIRLPQAS